jgi:hypothetical protein
MEFNWVSALIHNVGNIGRAESSGDLSVQIDAIHPGADAFKLGIGNFALIGLAFAKEGLPWNKSTGA